MDLTLHGKIQNIPASEVEVRVDRKAPYRIHVRGRVDERMFYGPKLELWTDVSTEPGSPSRAESIALSASRARNEGARVTDVAFSATSAPSVTSPPSFRAGRAFRAGAY